MWLNLPLISWLWLRGKCAECRAPISFRYFGVELLTALLFVAMWSAFPVQVVLFMWLLVSLLVAITFIDAEHLIIPTLMTWVGTAAGLAAAFVWPSLPSLGGGQLFEGGVGERWDGLLQSGIGFAVGFFGLWAVVNLGKLAFGKKEMEFDVAEAWRLKEPDNDEDPLFFVIDGEEISWWDLFTRPTDRLLIEAQEVNVNGEPAGGGSIVIREVEVELGDGSVHRIEDLKSLDGTATKLVIPREAMGFGDVHLLGMIGAFFGWSGAFYALFAASLLAIVAALIGRVGFGRPLPFGPFLAMAAISWALGGWKIWQWYVGFLSPAW